MVQSYDNPIFLMSALIVNHDKEAKPHLQLCKVGVVANSSPYYLYIVLVLLANMS